MQELSAEIWKALDGLRGALPAPHSIEVLLYDAAHHMGMPEDEANRTHLEWASLKTTDAYATLTDARMRLLSASPSERLHSIDEMLARAARSDHGVVWISQLPARRIAELAGNATRVRCAFDASLHPALLLSMQERFVRFASQDHTTCQLATMVSTIVETRLDVVPANPFSRTDAGEFDAEIIMSPFGLKIPSGTDIPKSTLSILGETERSRRLSSDPVAIADGLQSLSKRIVISVVEGMMFRAVGVEPIAREALVESGRLEAIFSVPGGMVFPHTGVATNLLVLGPNGQTRHGVRFINLSDKRFAGKTVRGRPEARPESSWLDAIDKELASDERFAADVTISDIKAKDYNLSLERYLLPPAVMAVDAFLAERQVRPLEDVVEMIRPLSLGKEDDGEFMIREAVPADIGDDELLTEPKKKTLIERAQLRKARNQRLMPGDLLLSIKGTIGAVALVPNDAAVDGDSGFWTAGQSFMVLRPRKGGSSSIALFEYLSNNAVRETLRSLAGGAGIPTVSIKDLRQFKVPVLTPDEEAGIEANFWDRQNQLAQVRARIAEIEKSRKSSWPHDKLHEVGA